MSSDEVPNPDGYRRSAGERLLAVHFGFLNKNTAIANDGTPKFSTSARDVLLDACQGYRFGNILENALSEWSDAVTRALKKLNSTIRDLNTKDFAYLIRFRLRADATGLANYIDWLFGEHLRGLTEHEICWTHGSFADLDGEERLEDMIEGAHDGATGAIAKIFHGVRVGGRRNRPDHEYRLGDLFVQTDADELLVVITPDCDLVIGRSGARERRAKVTNILTMHGTLYRLNADEAVADELLLRDNNPCYVGWRTKDLSTFPIKGDHSLHEDPQFRYIGTLKPLYALRTQAKALADLSRIGLPVAPALGVNTSVSVWLKEPNGAPFELEPSFKGVATIVPKREGQREGHRALLPRKFVHAVMEKLVPKSRKGKLAPGIQRLSSRRQEFYDWLLVKGGDTNGTQKLGAAFHFDEPSNKQDAAWLQFILNASEQVRDSLDPVDPLAP